MTQNWPIQSVHLNVANLRQTSAFYTDVIGLSILNEKDASITLGAGEQPLIVLHEQSDGQPSTGGTGLYHLAILLPTRRDLAQVLHHFSRLQTPLQGLADHGVSEAIYLADPEGNGLEIYADRPRQAWPMRDGELQMISEYPDVENILSELDQASPAPLRLPDQTIMGHIHLHVSDLIATERFYKTLSLDLIQRYGGMALFMSWEGYHHHVGLNTWRRGPASEISPNTLGLRYFSLDLGGAKAEVLANLAADNIPLEDHPDGVLVRDPVQNGILIL